MKTITIPTCANPFVVIVNGIKYTYPAGATMEVPDDVAEVIEQHNETHNNPKPDPVPPPYSGGVKSWNDLTDKPFGGESVTIEWDGDSTGKVTISDGELVKVSDLTPEPTELIGGTVVLTDGEGTETHIITEDMITDERSEGTPSVMVMDYIFIIYETVPEMGITETGIFFLSGGLAYVSSLTYGTIKKLDSKYLPETETNIYTYDSLDQVPADLPEGSFVAVPSTGESQENQPLFLGLTTVGLDFETIFSGVEIPVGAEYCDLIYYAAMKGRPVVLFTEEDGVRRYIWMYLHTFDSSSSVVKVVGDDRNYTPKYIDVYPDGTIIGGTPDF